MAKTDEASAPRELSSENPLLTVLSLPPVRQVDGWRDALSCYGLTKGELSVLKNARCGDNVLPVASAAPTIVSPTERFKNNIKSVIQTPDSRVIRKIQQVFSSQLLVCCDYPTVAVELYREAAQFPSTTTIACISRDARLSVGSQIDPDRPHLLAASDADGRPLVIKVLRHRPVACDEADLVRLQLLKNEAEMVRALEISSPDNAHANSLVCTRPETVTLSQLSEGAREAHEPTRIVPGPFTVLVMAHYVTTVTRAPRFTSKALVTGGRRMLQALEYMHFKQIAHLNVKGDNVFVDMDGRWWLGDFGSARSFAADSAHTVVSTTPEYYPWHIYGQRPRPQVDWYMLCVLLCLASLDPRAYWTEIFGSPVQDHLIRAYVENLEDEHSGLSALLTELLRRHDAA